jgi:Co/Zn/Cd efflux system component
MMLGEIVAGYMTGSMALHARIADLHVWRIGPEAHAAIVGVIAAPGVGSATIRERLSPVHELAHLTIECH